jgi:hypothetical protein
MVESLHGVEEGRQGVTGGRGQVEGDAPGRGDVTDGRAQALQPEQLERVAALGVPDALECGGCGGCGARVSRWGKEQSR